MLSGGNDGGRWQRGGSRGRFRGRGYAGNRSRGRSNYHPRYRLEDDGDIAMDDGRNSRMSSRHEPYGGGPRNTERRREPINWKEDVSDTNWWKIVVPDGNKHNRDWLFKRLESSANVPIVTVAVNVHTYKENLIFFVNEESVASALISVSNTITTKDGTKIFISVRPSPPPKYGKDKEKFSNIQERELSQEQMEVLRSFLGSRFDPETIKLDLSNMYFDKILRGGNIEGKIFNLMEPILKLIHDICPQLKILDLSNNRVSSLRIIENLSEMCPDLEELDLSKNVIRYPGEVTKLKGNRKLKKLWLTDNPLKDQFERSGSENSYRIEVRKYLPQLKELDGVDLPPAIVVVENKLTLPPYSDGYTVNSEASKLISEFVKNFINVYDSEDVNDRQELLQAYHNDATFSMCLNTGVPNNEKQAEVDPYIRSSRNLLKAKDRNLRAQLIKHKKLSVVAALTELPKTKHILESFLLDVPMLTSSALSFILHGLFYSNGEENVLAFTRNFMAVPGSSTGGFLIINDQLQIRNLTDKQLKMLKSIPNKISSVPSKTSSVQGETTLSPGANCSPEQQVLLQRFSTESKMNLKWSFNALNSNNWDFEQAALKFRELKNLGKIPREAFNP